MVLSSTLFLEWSGEVRSITYSADGKSVSVVYRVTLYGTDAEVFKFLQHYFMTMILVFKYTLCMVDVTSPLLLVSWDYNTAFNED